MRFIVLFNGLDTGKRIDAPNADLALREACDTLPVLDWHRISVQRDPQDQAR